MILAARLVLILTVLLAGPLPVGAQLRVGRITTSIEREPSTERGRIADAILYVVAEDVDTRLETLPEGLALVAAPCARADAFYDPNRERITLCLELIDEILSLLRTIGTADPLDDTYDAGLFFAYHEMGHALVNLYDLPVLGNPEDAADQFATWWLLRSNTSDPVRVASFMFLMWGADRSGGDGRQYGHLHPLSEQRHLNLLCWLAGFGLDLPENTLGLLPPQRLLGCRDEYSRIAETWSRQFRTRLRS